MKSINIITYLKYIIISALAFLLIVESNYFCNDKIFDPNNLLTIDQIKTLCSGIQKSIFIISLQKEPRLNYSTNEDTKKLFHSMCKTIKLCKSGVIISIFPKIVEIYSGSEMKSKLCRSGQTTWSGSTIEKSNPQSFQLQSSSN